MSCRVVVLLCSFWIGSAQANWQVARQVLDQPAVVGQARLTVLLFKVYDATLYAPKGRYLANQPFVLTLRYLREFKGEKIAQRTVDEMRKQGFTNQAKLTAWLHTMTSLFPDVQPGVELSAVRLPSGATDFYRGEQLIGQVSDPEFARQFFAIWLGEKTSEPAMRRQLLKLASQ